MMPYLFMPICHSTGENMKWFTSKGLPVTILQSFQLWHCAMNLAHCFSCWVYIKDSVFVLNVLDSLCIRCVCVCVCVLLGGCGVIGSCIIALLCYQRYFGGCVSQASHLLITQGLSVSFGVQTKHMA